MSNVQYTVTYSWEHMPAYDLKVGDRICIPGAADTMYVGPISDLETFDMKATFGIELSRLIMIQMPHLAVFRGENELVMVHRINL